MRQIATLSNPQEAKILSDYFCIQNIDHSIEAEDSHFEVWVHDDNQLEAAQLVFEEFQKNPRAFEAAHFKTQAKELRKEDSKLEKKNRQRYVDIRTQWNGFNYRTGILTLTLILISVLVSLFSQLGAESKNIDFLFIASPEKVIQKKFADLSDAQFQEVLEKKKYEGLWSPLYLQELKRGEVWRLITPIFIHFGILHLIFNMMWLKDLGSIIEKHEGWWYLGLMTVIIGAASNFCQYLVSGPNFGGMSGVVYGLLGYLWIRGKFDPRAHLILNPTVVIWMIGWFFLCLTGAVGNVANTAHGVGLAVGMIWGYLSSGHLKRIFR